MPSKVEKTKELAAYTLYIVILYFILFVFWWLMIHFMNIRNDILDRILKSAGQLVAAIIILEIEYKKGEETACQVRASLRARLPSNLKLFFLFFLATFSGMAFTVFLAVRSGALGLEVAALAAGAWPSTLLNLTALSVLSIITVAIGEEIIFRGLLLNRHHAILGSMPAVLILNSALFALVHFNFGFPLIILFIGSFLFGVSYVKFRNLFIPIAIHFAYNFSFFWFAIYDEQGTYPAVFVRTDGLPTEVAFGWYNIALSLILILIVWALPQKWAQLQPEETGEHPAGTVRP